MQLCRSPNIGRAVFFCEQLATLAKPSLHPRERAEERSTSKCLCLSSLAYFVEFGEFS